MRNINFVFDLDGTLIDSSRGIYISYLESIKKANINLKDIDYFDFKKNIGPPFEIMIEALHPNLNASEYFLLNKSFREIYDSVGFLNYKVYNNILECVNYLNKAGHYLYILSNKRNSPTQIIIKNEFPNTFKNVWGKDNNSFNKCDILKKIKRNSINHTFYIGDTINDKKSAQDAGVEFIYASYGFGNIPKTNNLIICRNSSELKETLINTLNNIKK